MRTKYIIEINDLGIERDTCMWSCWDTLVAEGNTLDELMQDATLFACDQDGGEAGQCSLGDLSHYEYVRLVEQIIEQYRIQGII